MINKKSLDPLLLFCQRNEVGHRLCNDFLHNFFSNNEVNKISYDVYFCPPAFNHEEVCHLGVITSSQIAGEKL